MIRGLFIFFFSLILLSTTQFKHSCIENETQIIGETYYELFSAELLTFESTDQPGQFGDIRLLKQKTSKVRTKTSTLWFVSNGIFAPTKFTFFVTSSRNLPAGKNVLVGSLPLYLELNKLLI
jgi:hypothetical protein